MAIDTAAKRRSAAGLPFGPFGPGVSPDAAKSLEWRQQVAWGYSGVPTGGSPRSPSGDGDFWWFKPYLNARVFWGNGESPLGANPERGLTLYTTKREDKTFGIDFSTEGLVRDRAALSAPQVEITKHSSVTGNPVVPGVSGGPDIVPDGDWFHDSDGRKIKSGKGVRVRIDSSLATPGKYTLHCTVVATPPGGGDPDTLEGGGVLVVE